MTGQVSSGWDGNQLVTRAKSLDTIDGFHLGALRTGNLPPPTTFYQFKVVEHKLRKTKNKTLSYQVYYHFFSYIRDKKDQHSVRELDRDWFLITPREVVAPV